MEDRIDSSMLALKALNGADLNVVGKYVERGARDMVMDPVNWTSIACPRVGLQVINPDPFGRPCCNSRIVVVHPDLASLFACGCQMNRHDEGSFAGNGCRLIGKALGGRQPRNRDLLFRRRRYDETRSLTQ